MITELDEAIKHCKEKAEEKRKDYERAVALNIPIDYIKEFPDLIVFKDAPKQELEENLPQHMPLKYKPLKFPEDGFIAKYGTRNSKK